MSPRLGGIVVKLEILQGKGLVPKDRKLASLGRLVTSDPFIKVYGGKKFLGKTRVVKETLDPVWNESFQLILGAEDANLILENDGAIKMELRIFDHDEGKDHDPMGVVRIPLQCTEAPSTKWYSVLPGKGRSYCKDARGSLQIFVSVLARKMLSLVRGNNHILQHKKIKVGLSWDMENGEEIDLDTSCVALDYKGRVSMKDTVYYGNLRSSDGAIVHSGDQKDGKASGDDEVIVCDLDNVKSKTTALYFLLTVATPGKTFMNVKSAKVRLLEMEREVGLCHFEPANFGAYTAMFLFRVARTRRKKWVLSVIEDFDAQARDFGSLIPELKGYTSDLIPRIKVNPRERIAVMRKGALIRVDEYAGGLLPKWVAFGLKWDVTDGHNVDLDASAVCLSKDLKLLDIVCFKQLRSKDNSIRHSGDEKEGDAVGDDETILLSLPNTSLDIQYVGFVINSFSGHELDDIARASCHLYDPDTGEDIAMYTLSNASELDKHTALIMGCIFRESDDDWNLRIISLPAQGKTAHDNVKDLQRFLRRNPPPEPQRTPATNTSTRSMPSQVEHEEDGMIVPAAEFKSEVESVSSAAT